MNSDTPQTNEELIDAAHCAECGYEVVLADAMRKLERELAEARERNAVLQSQVENADTNLDQVRLSLLSAYRKDTSQLNEKLLALSVAYQRQKEALSEIGAICRASQDNPGDEDVDWFAEIENRTHAALAETPDVSMLEKVVAALKLAYARGHYCDNVPCPGCECGHVLDSILGCTVSQDECEQFVTSHFIKVSTLQPDHQK